MVPNYHVVKTSGSTKIVTKVIFGKKNLGGNQGKANSW